MLLLCSDHEIIFIGGLQGAYVMDFVELLDLETGIKQRFS
jgi:hypothetical protein